jgi:hypothetical protein
MEVAKMRNTISILAILSLSVFLNSIGVFAGDVGGESNEKGIGLITDMGAGMPYPGLNEAEKEKIKQQGKKSSIASERDAERKVLDITPMVGCGTLEENISYPIVVDSLQLKYNQGFNWWAVVGVRPYTGSNWDIELFSDSCAMGSLLAGSYNFNEDVDFVVRDYNHAPMGWGGVSVYRSSGSANADIEYEDNAEVLSIGSNIGNQWLTSDVVKIYDIVLFPGEYTFGLNVSLGTGDFGIALFASNGADYSAGRSGAEVESDTGGPGDNEGFNCTANDTDWYGVVVWTNDTTYAEFDIHVNPVGIGDETGAGPVIPMTFALSQNYPNPFNPSTVISYQLPERANVTLKIHDIRGRMICELVNEIKEVGSYSVQWNGKDALGQEVPSGVYLCVINTDKGFRTTRKMVLLK